MGRTPLPENMARLYHLMESSKHYVDIDPTGNVSHRWQGFAKDLAKEMAMSPNSVYRIVAHLTENGCIRLIRHGGMNTPSIYELLRAPDNSAVLLRDRAFMDGRIQAPSKTAKLQDAITRLTNRVTELERQMQNRTAPRE